ncbi:MAG: hypothetical protein FIB07_12515 [Candidatus Methanoperedens sp.]|nr:hypothetical protein [Candidatus Methanoperedens sp.]
MTNSGFDSNKIPTNEKIIIKINIAANTLNAGTKSCLTLFPSCDITILHIAKIIARIAANDCTVEL